MHRFTVSLATAAALATLVACSDEQPLAVGRTRAVDTPAAPIATSTTTPPPATAGPAVVGAGSLSADTTHEWAFAFTNDDRTEALVTSGTTTDWGIHTARLEGGTWQLDLHPTLNVSRNSGAVSVSADGDRLVLAAEGDGTGTDIFVAARTEDGWGVPQAVAAVNTADSEETPHLAPDGSLWFASDRDGGFDIYVAAPDGAGFGEPRKLGADVNEDFEAERWPRVTADGARLLWVRDNSRLMAADLQSGDVGDAVEVIVPGHEGAWVLSPEVDEDGVLWFAGTAGPTADIYRWDPTASD